MKIRTYLRLNIALAVVAPLLISGLLFSGYRHFSRALQDGATINAIRQDINDLTRLALEISISPNRRSATQLTRKHESFSRFLNEVSFGSPAGTAILQRLVRQNQALAANSGQIREILEAREAKGIVGDPGGVLAQLTVQLVNQLQQLRSEAVSLSALVDRQNAERHRLTGLSIVGVGSLIAILLIGTALITRLRLGKPLAAMGKGIRKMIAGDLEVRLTPKYQDELGELAQTFNAMVESRREVERHLRASEAKYRTLVENLPQKIFLKGTDLSYVSCNRAYALELDISTEQLTGKTDFDFYPVPLAEKYRNEDRQVLESGQILQIEESYREGDRELWVNIVKTPVRDEEGKIVGLLGAFWDVTARKEAEAQARRLAAILENTPDYVATADAEGHITWVNAGGRQILGLAPGEDVSSLTVADTHPAWAGRLIVDDGLPTARRSGTWKGENALLNRTDGRETPVLQVIIAHRDEAGEVAYYSTIARDLSERKQAEEEIRRLNSELEERVALRTAELEKTVAELERVAAERLLVENALRASEGLYRSLVENIDLGITLIDSDYRIRMTNAGQGKMLGQRVGDFIGKFCFQKFEHHDTVCPHCPGTVAMRSGKPAEVETSGMIEDGREIKVRIHAFPILDEAGKATGFIEVIEDITERKRFEEQLAETRRRLQALMDNLPGMAYRCRNDEDWTMEFVSRGSAELTGYPAEDLVGNHRHSYAALIHPEDRQRVWDEVQQALGQQEDFSLEYRIVTAAGQTRQVWEKGSGVFKENGEVLALEGFVMDISDRMAAENELRERKEFIETIIRNLPIGLSVHTIDDGRFRYMNRSFQELYGWPREILLDVEAFFEHVYPDPVFRREISSRIYADMASGDPERMVWENVPITRQTGEKAVVSARNIPMIEKNLMISTVWDVTAYHTARENLESTITDLQRSNQELEQFAYVASHDLQEPLRMVGSYVQLLARRYRGQLDADADEFIDFAVEGATRMQRLINDLLAFSRVGRQQGPHEPVDCNEILATVSQNLETAIEETGAGIIVEPLPRVMGNYSQLTQVFQNLLANAIKFHGQPPPRIEVSAKREGASWVFAVRDNGIGIDPQYFDKVFVIFQRLHGKRDYPGTGIGLALTKKIIEQHGGRIWIESSPGQGATFLFTLKGAN